jgi:hypothetical protein
MNKNLSQTRGVRTVIKGLMITGSLYLLVIVYTLLTATRGLANTPDIDNARTKYPNIVGTKLDSCSLCHTSNIPGLNPYGQDYKANGRNMAALGAIESLDSDKDGFTNIKEIMALTFPGNPSDFPKTNTSTPTATSAPTATMPPTATSTRVPSPTAPNPSPTAPYPGPTETMPAPSATVPIPGPTATGVATLTPAPSPTAIIQPTGTPQCRDQNGRKCGDDDHHKRHHRHRHRHSKRS